MLNNWEYRIPVILIILTIHELGHAWMAKILGDDTAESQGRITLNPLSHLDPIGTIMLLFGPFGWAKPVPVNPLNFTDPKKHMAIVAAAGPIANVLLAAIVGLFFRFGLVNPGTVLEVFFWTLFYYNIGLAFFNLLPVYPLDGSRIIVAFLNHKRHVQYMKVMTYVPFIFLTIILIDYITKNNILGFILSPIFYPTMKLARKIFIGI